MFEASSSCTVTQRFQTELETVVGSLYEILESASEKERAQLLTLCTDYHEHYAARGLRRLSAGFSGLDSSRPWLCYWILHSIALLGRSVDEGLYNRTISFLEHCQDPSGGYGGGPGQMAHLATTYAAVCALVTLGGEKALASINREKILQFLLRMKDPCGGFRVHDDGEMDMRGSYTALAVAHMLDIMVPELVEKVGEHVKSCQTYEGGIGGEPGAEAHGGYTFCGLAALALVNQLHVVDLPNLAHWVAFRQGRVEGGFQGRTNKLVDGCYSFWQGGCFQVLQQHMPHLWAQQLEAMTSLNTTTAECEEKPTVCELGGDIESDDTSKGDKEMKVGLVEEDLTCLQDSIDVKGKAVSEALPKREEHSILSERSTVVKEISNDSADATGGRPSSQTDEHHYTNLATTNISMGRSGEPSMPTGVFPPNDWSTDGNSSDFWESNSKQVHNSSEKLFPMVEIGFLRQPLHVKFEEIVELPNDDTDLSEGQVSGNGDDSNRSAVELDGSDECLYGPIFNSRALQAYILLCCQDMEGGLRDKPGKCCDYYHTCYCLSGLAGAQYAAAHRIGAPPPPSGVVGPYSNLLEATHALCNVRLDRYFEARNYFKRFS